MKLNPSLPVPPDMNRRSLISDRERSADDSGPFLHENILDEEQKIKDNKI